MSSPQQSWLKPGLRFCGSCCISILCWAIWLLLSASLATLVYVVVAKEMPVPGFVLRRIETRLAEADLSIRFGHAQLDPTGKILLEDVQIRSRQFEEPLLLARLVYARRSVWSILAGRPIPDEIRLEGATVQLPAMLSPSGAVEPMIRDLSAVLRYDGGNVFHIAQLTGRLGKLKFTAVGDVALPAAAAGRKIVPQEAVARFLKFGRSLVLKSDRLDAFDEPSLEIRFEHKPEMGTIASCTFIAESGRQPWSSSVDIGAFIATSTFSITSNRDQVASLHVAAKNINGRNLLSADSLEAVLSLKIREKDFEIKPIEGWLTAGLVTTDGEKILSPILRANLRQWPSTLQSDVLLAVDGEAINLQVSANLEKQNAVIGIEGTGRPESINRVLRKHTPRAAPYFVFSDPVRVIANATLAPNWRFEKFSGRVWAGRINSRGVEINTARGKIDIQGTSFLAHDAQLELGENFGRGSYWMDFATSDYRMLLEGNLRPSKIAGWFGGSWWTEFWNEHFDFSELPHGDVDVQGRWRDSTHTEYFGNTVAKMATVWGGTFEEIEALVFLRPFFTHVVNIKGTRAAGTQALSGSLKRTAEMDSREKNTMEFDLAGNLDSETYHRMLEGKADDVFAAFQFDAPPQVQAQGKIAGVGKEASTHYRFSGHTVGDIRYYGFPIHRLEVSGQVNEGNIILNDIQFLALGGKGAGKATLNGPVEKRRLGFDLYLNNADLPQTIRTVQDYQASRNGDKPSSTGDNSIIKRVLGGRVDVALSAQGLVGDPATFVGTGNAAVNGANLGEIQLFGLLSQVLSGLSFHFSTLKLDSAHTSFRWEREHLHFPDLKITGPSAVIDAQGDFYLKNNNLDFAAKFKPFEESKSLFTAAIGIVINPITSILELKLNGPLSKPSWSIDFGSSFPRHDPTATSKENTPTPDSPANLNK